MFVGDERIDLEAGEVWTVEELLYAMLLESANDAALAVAEHVGGTVAGFVKLMNDEAAKLGMDDTSFDNPHGLDAANHFSSARDLLTLAQAMMAVDELARRHDGSFRSKFSGRLAELRVGEARLALLKPETYMNLSGGPVGAAARFFKVPPEALVVVHDDVDLEPGRLQVRLGGGLAGHNGLRSIAQALGTQEFLRVRIGVGRPGRGDRRDVADFVLSRFEPEENGEALIAKAADAVEVLAAEGLDAAQRRFN